MKKLALIALTAIMFSCDDGDTLPKPKALLRLDYPNPEYKEVNLGVPFTFERNKFSKPITNIKVNTKTGVYGINIEYPKLKGTIYLTYKSVENNLNAHLRDAQNLTQKHTVKADEISEQLYANKKEDVYGMFYEVGGNAASQSQFYVTDSVNHFVNGSLYFYTKPNYDSIYPAAQYLKNDIKQIMESLKWKDISL